MTTFPCPKWLRNCRFGGSFLSCAVAKTICFADWTEKGPSWEALFSITCISQAFWKGFSYFRSWICHHLAFADWTENGPSLEALFSLTCIWHAFWMGFSYFRSWFWNYLWNTLPISLQSIAAFTKQLPHDECFQQSPIVHSMLFFAYPNSIPPIINWRAAVCPPQRAFNETRMHTYIDIKLADRNRI